MPAESWRRADSVCNCDAHVHGAKHVTDLTVVLTVIDDMGAKGIALEQTTVNL